MKAEPATRLHSGLTDIAVGLGAFGVAAGLVTLLPAQVGGETLAAIGNMRSPAFFPAVAALLMAGLGVLLVLRGLLSWGRQPVAAAAPDAAPTPAGDARRAGAVALLLIATALALPHAGFVPSVVVMMAGVGVAFGYRRLPILAVLCLILPIGIFFVFDGALRVLLPRGPL